jgi:hypothetical protein
VKFAIIVVFDNYSATAPGKLDERVATVPGRGHPKRKLMRGTDADHTRVGWEPFDNNPLGIDFDGDNSCAGRDKGHAHRRVAGILYRNDSFVGLDQDPCEQIERLLGAGGDDDVVRAADDGARKRDVPRNRLAKTNVSLIALRTLAACRPFLQLPQLLDMDRRKTSNGNRRDWTMAGRKSISLAALDGRCSEVSRQKLTAPVTSGCSQNGFRR